MSADKPAIGSVGWHDLTTGLAPQLKDFYARVIGWTVEEFDMGGYADYVMKCPATGAAVAGICHARGPNAGLPAQWLIYVTVADLEQSVQACLKLGGEVLQRRDDHNGMAVVRDPAGAVLTLVQQAP